MNKNEEVLEGWGVQVLAEEVRRLRKALELLAEVAACEANWPVAQDADPAAGRWLLLKADLWARIQAAVKP